jgi:thiol-disulfide isomerase/thioredoxin
MLEVSRRTVLAATILGAASLAFRTAAGQSDAVLSDAVAASDSDEVAKVLTRGPALTATATPELPLPPPEMRSLSVPETERRRVLYFYAEWCVLSQRARSYSAQLARAYGELVNYSPVDIDTLEGDAWVRLYQVPFVPVFVVLSPDGQAISMLYSPADMSRNVQVLTS